MSYDQSCYDLAAAFLVDHPEKNNEANRNELAQHIQTEIEDWIEFILLPAGPVGDVGNSLPSGKSSQPADSTGNRTGGSK